MKSVFLKRILSLIIITVVLFVLLTSSIYILLSRDIYSDMKSRELKPKAETIGNFVLMYNNGEIPLQYFTQLISAGPSAWDAWVFVLDSKGNMMIQTTIPESVDPDKSFIKGISSKTSEVLSGKNVEFTGNLPNNELGMMIVGVPVTDSTGVVGAVFLAKPLYEINAGIDSLNGALFISTLICLIVMIIPTIYATKRILKPLKETRKVALAMANGDFSVRATTITEDEFGDLAKSFNLLADRLEKTVSDLVMEKNRIIRILNGLAEGIIAVDIQCNVTHVNPALFKLINSINSGSSFECIPQVNENALVLRPDNPQFIRSQLIADDAVWDDFRNVILTSIPVNREIHSNERIIRIAITPTEDDFGNTIGAVGLFQDITESEILEQTRKDYVANVSHEFRTPLTAMRGLIEPLADGLVKSDDTKKKYYDIILRETMRLSRLIDDMLELSRLQSKKTSIETKTFSLHEVIEDVVDKYSKAAVEKGVTLAASDNFKTLPMLVGNSDRIEQILIILIDNALKFTPSGKDIFLDVAYDKRKKTEKVFVSVKDTGVGIDPDKVKNVFDRFYKTNKARYGTEGTGLGLSIAKEILNAMNEEIFVTSTLGKGSTFTFSLSIKK